MAGRRNRAAWSGFDAAFRPWMSGRLRVCMTGLPRDLPARGPVVLVSNHVSWWDGFLLRAVQREIRPRSPLYTIALERELARHPILRVLGGIGITPSSPASILRAIRSVASRFLDCPDLVLGYFPQGCITPSFRRPLAFTRGIDLFLSRLAGATVVPVAIHIEPLTSVAPTAFISIGNARRIAGYPVDSATLEDDVTRLLDLSLASLALQGENATATWPGGLDGGPAPIAREPQVPALRSTRTVETPAIIDV